MPRVLFVTKPLSPPWNDSGKNVPRDLARRLAGLGVEVGVMTRGGALPQGLGVEGVVAEPVYRDSGRFSPSRLALARVMWRLVAGEAPDITHFFFAPNPVTSAAMGVALRARAPRGSVHTVLSVPRALVEGRVEPRALRRLFATDRVVTLSEATARRLRGAGVEGVVTIAPGVEASAPLEAAGVAAARRHFALPREAKVVLFPGDYQFSDAAALVADAAPLVLDAVPEAYFVFACRLKQPASRVIESRLRAQLRPWRGRIQMRRQVARMGALVGASDVVTLPQRETYAKADLPIVLLEAMAAGRPVVVVDAEPIAEVVAEGGGVACRPDDPEALAAALIELLSDDAGRARLGAEARAVATTRFSMARAARAHLDLYEGLLGG